MSDARGTIVRIALVEWRGMRYLEFALDTDTLTVLVGENGAGKSTVGMLLCYALMPDRTAMEIKPISSVSDAQHAGIDRLAGQINPLAGYAYFMLDIWTRRGDRLVIGLHTELIDGYAKFQPIVLRDVPNGWALQDCVRVLDDTEESYPDLGELTMSLARRGVTLVELKTVREYCSELFEAGVLPCDLSDRGDRYLYGRLVSSCFLGGVSQEVAKRLKEYVLPEASRLPASIDRLQQCMNSVSRTRGALAKAEEHLSTLEATYGLGKSIVCRAISRLNFSVDEARARLDALGSAARELNSQIGALDASVLQLEQMIDGVKGARQAIELGAQTELEEEAIEKQRLVESRAKHAKAAELSNARWVRYCQGRDGWMRWREEELGSNVEEVKASLNRLIDEQGRLRWMLEHELKQVSSQEAVLRDGIATHGSAGLAVALGATSIASRYENVGIEDARQLEASLAGLVDGVFCSDLSALVGVTDNPNFPHTFWIRTSAPDAALPQTIGEWIAVPTQGGYVVMSNRRKLSLGRGARESELKRLEGERLKLVARSLAANSELATLKADLTELTDHEADIREYLDSREQEAQVRQAAETDGEIVKQADIAISQSDDRSRAISRRRSEKLNELDLRRDDLGKQLRESESQQRDKQSKRTALEASLSEWGNRLASSEAILNQCELLLGSSWRWLLSYAQTLEQVSHDSYIAMQSMAITKLGHGLKNEPDARLAWLHIASPGDPLSLCAIWSPLQEIVNALVSIDAIDEDGANVLSEMTDRRRKLSETLGEQRSELRTEAKSLYSTITTEIRKQAKRIKRLSSFGESLAFGKVTGIRIEPRQRKELLDRLLSVTEQLDLFAAHSDAPLDVQLSAAFNEARHEKLESDVLLDYRTYMDVAIEVQRPNGEWENAIGLSGGEAIGGGLAISLMLVRFLAQRDAQTKPRPFTHVAVMDEIQRLTASGQELVAEFAREQGVQVLATATAVDAEFPFTMYVMARTHFPEELVVARRVVVGGIRAETD